MIVKVNGYPGGNMTYALIKLSSGNRAKLVKVAKSRHCSAARLAGVLVSQYLSGRLVYRTPPDGLADLSNKEKCV